MVTTLYLIRHGETEGSGEKRYKGSIDVPLSAIGVEQIGQSAAFILENLKKAARAKYLGYLREIHSNNAPKPDDKERPMLSAVYCSALGRALESAEIIAGVGNLEPVVIPDLRERSFGRWEGMSFSEIKEQYPLEFEAWASNPVTHSPVGGESTLEVKERVVSAFENIMKKHGAGCGEEDTNIAIVAHGGVNRVLLCHILGIPLENVFRIEQDHAAVNIIEFWDRYPVVKLLNGGTLG